MKRGIFGKGTVSLSITGDDRDAVFLHIFWGIIVAMTDRLLAFLFGGLRASLLTCWTFRARA